MTRLVDVSLEIERRKSSYYSATIVVMSMIVALFDGIDLFTISYTAPYIADDYHLSSWQIGNIFSSGLFGMVIGGFILGYLADRIGRRPAIVYSFIFLGVATLAFPLAEQYASLLGLRFVIGLALGGLVPVCYTLNIEFVPKTRRATVVTLILMGLAFGSALAAPLTVWIVPLYGWRGLYILEGIATLAYGAILYAFLPESPRFLTVKRGSKVKLSATMARLNASAIYSALDDYIVSDESNSENRAFRIGHLFEGKLAYITPLLWISFSACYIAVQFMATWSPIIFERVGLERSTAAFASSAMSFVAAIAGIALMRFTDKHGPVAILLYPILAFPMLILLGSVQMAPNQFIAANIVAALVVKGTHFGISSILGIYYPSNIRANGIGWATGIAKFASIAGPAIGAAVLSSKKPIITTYLIFSICPIVIIASIVAMIIIVRPATETKKI